jgi:hypothetical protein
MSPASSHHPHVQAIIQMRHVMVRYEVKPDRVAENEALVRAVDDDLQRTEPAGLRHATLQLAEIREIGSFHLFP